MSALGGGFDPRRYWEQRLAKPDITSVGYLSLGRSYNRWLYRLRRRIFLREARRLRSSWAGCSVLDVGSGTGVYVSLWAEVGASVTASDLTQASVDALAASQPEIPAVLMDITEPPSLRPGSFDAISAFDVLFHIVDDDRYARALEHIARLLKDGAYFLFSDNFVHTATVRAEHQVSRPLAETEAQLASLGLEIVRRRPMFIVMNAPLDAPGRIHRLYWSALERLLARVPQLGAVVGMSLYPVETLLVSIFRESPSTELMVCRKREAN